MTDTEFNAWWSDVSIRFSEQCHWFSKDRSEEQQLSTLETWFEILKTVPLDEALAANRQLQADGLRLHIDQLPALVRSRAADRQAKRREPSARELKEQKELERRLKSFPARKIHSRILQVGRDLNWKKERLQAKLREWLPAWYYEQVCTGPSVAELRKAVGI